MLCLTSFHLQQFKARVLCNCMDHTWLAAVTMHTTNLILVPKISWWFVFILICGRRERSKKKNHFSVYAQQYVKTEIISLHLQKIIINPNFLVIRFTFLYGTKTRKGMTGLKRVICRLIKRSSIRGKTYSDHYMSVIILENKTQKQHCYILVAMETKVGKVI